MTIASALRRRFDGYGKLGLLVDDSNDAESRLARQLYGAEELPRWWCVVRSRMCGKKALDALQTMEVPKDKLLIVLDLRLWNACEPQAHAEPLQRDTFPLDDVAPLIPRARILPLTSYPEVREAKVCASGLRWTVRSLDVFRELRCGLWQYPRHPLLRYGPEPDASPGDSEQGWQRKMWQRTIHEIAGLLRRTGGNAPAVILFTGAGCSLSAGPLGNGMPLTGRVLESAIREEMDDRVVDSQPLAPLPKCVCQEFDPGDNKYRMVAIPTRPVPMLDLIEECFRNDRTLSMDKLVYSLEAVFAELTEHELEDAFAGITDKQKKNREKKKRRKEHQERVQKVYAAFRRRLHAHDHGFAYHHWLAAQLPWRRIVTTNFDSFLERAAAAATAEDRNREIAIRFASPMPYRGLPEDSAEEEYRLWKIYGSLLLPRISLAREEIANAYEHARQAFLPLQTALQAILVIAGHGMRDLSLVRSIKEIASYRHNTTKSPLKIVWLDPRAWQLARDPTLAPENDYHDWLLWMNRAVSPPTSMPTGTENLPPLDAIPLPGRALDFFWDLFASYHDKP